MHFKEIDPSWSYYPDDYPDDLDPPLTENFTNSQCDTAGQNCFRYRFFDENSDSMRFHDGRTACPKCKKLTECVKTKYSYVHSRIQIENENKLCGIKFEDLLHTKFIHLCLISEDVKFRKRLNIHSASLELGQIKGRGLYNEFVTKMLLNPKEQTSLDLEVEACLDMLKKVAIIDIELTNHDSIKTIAYIKSHDLDFATFIGKLATCEYLINHNNKIHFQVVPSVCMQGSAH